MMSKKYIVGKRAAFVKSNYLKISGAAIAEKIGCEKSAVYRFYSENGIVVPRELKLKFRAERLASRTTFNKREDRFITKHYLTMPVKVMGQKIGRSWTGIMCRLRQMGLEIPKDLRAERRVSGCFRKGHEPNNKGKKMPKRVYEKVRGTMFKKGNRPVNFKPVGSERIDAEGYKWIKTKNPNTWKMSHVLLWVKNRGRVPNGMVVIFKDKNRQNIRLTNLKLVTRGQLMKLNSYHNYGPEIARVIQMRGALQRQINKYAKHSRPKRNAV